jgi:hypothetical protein
MAHHEWLGEGKTMSKIKVGDRVVVFNEKSHFDGASGTAKSVTHNQIRVFLDILPGALMAFQPDELELETQQFEWGVMQRLEGKELHRGPWTEEFARNWLREGVEGGLPEDMFHLVRRPVGKWEKVD